MIACNSDSLFDLQPDWTFRPGISLGTDDAEQSHHFAQQNSRSAILFMEKRISMRQRTRETASWREILS